jgi:hypothetical protein
MNSYRTRRATVDDSAQLAELWQLAHLPAAELEKRFTEFQVAEDDRGRLTAAIALHIEESHGRIHSEAFVDTALTDTLRPALWQRLQIVAQNHGLFRLWTEETAPWWKENGGFSAPSAETLQKLPAPFGLAHAAWLTLRLRDEAADPDLLEKQIAMFRTAEKPNLEKLMRQGKILKIIGTVISLLLLIFALTVLFYVWKRRR